MKAFLVAMVAMAAITVGADLLLHRAGFSAAEIYKLPDVRLGQ